MGCWGCPLVAVGCWPWPVGWATPVVYPKVEKVAADLPLVAWCGCLDMLSRDVRAQEHGVLLDFPPHT